MTSASVLPLIKYPYDSLNILRERDPFVSIIVVTLGRVISDLKECVDSLLAQTYNKIEIIIVVDCPSPKIKALLNPYINKYMIKVFFNDNAVGISRARNIGIKASKGEIIAFIDDDAIADHRWLENLIRYYDKEVVGASCGRGIPKTSNPPKIAMLFSQQSLNRSTYVDYLWGCNMSIRRKALLEVGLFDPLIKYGCDEKVLAMRLIAGGYRIKYMPNAVVKHDYAGNWRKFFYKNFKFGESSVYINLLQLNVKNTESNMNYRKRTSIAADFLVETKSISILFGLLTMYIIRRVGILSGILKYTIPHLYKKRVSRYVKLLVCHEEH